MIEQDPDERARDLAAESLTVDDPTGWFERLYAEATAGEAVVPWDRGAPHPLLVRWAEGRGLDGAGRRALVVGCGPGSDAEYVAGLGFDTVAFDVSESAIAAARRRFPDSKVAYLVADLLDPPVEWREAFDLVVESYTMQALPDTVHGTAIATVAHMVAPAGTLLVITATREPDDAPIPGPPWPLTPAEVESFAIGDLRPVRIEDVPTGARPASYRRRAEFHRPRP